MAASGLPAASRSIDLAAAYFVPDKLTLHALQDALKRGVTLRIVVPGRHIDSDAVRGASRATWGPLLSAGATIAEYGSTMYHCKVVIVDKDFARTQTTVFESDLALARRVSFAEWQARPAREKLGDWLASLIGTQL